MRRGRRRAQIYRLGGILRALSSGIIGSSPKDPRRNKKESQTNLGGSIHGSFPPFLALAAAHQFCGKSGSIPNQVDSSSWWSGRGRTHTSISALIISPKSCPRGGAHRWRALWYIRRVRERVSGSNMSTVYPLSHGSIRSLGERLNNRTRKHWAPLMSHGVACLSRRSGEREGGIRDTLEGSKRDRVLESAQQRSGIYMSNFGHHGRQICSVTSILAIIPSSLAPRSLSSSRPIRMGYGVRPVISPKGFQEHPCFFLTTKSTVYILS